MCVCVCGVCVCVWVWVFMCVCMYVCMYVGLYVYTCVYAYVSLSMGWICNRTFNDNDLSLISSYDYKTSFGERNSCHIREVVDSDE